MQPPRGRDVAVRPPDGQRVAPRARSESREQPIRSPAQQHSGAEDGRSELELDAATYEAMVARATHAIGTWITSLPTQPMHRNRGAKKAVARLRRSLPETGAPFEGLLR